VDYSRVDESVKLCQTVLRNECAGTFESQRLTRVSPQQLSQLCRVALWILFTCIFNELVMKTLFNLEHCYR